MLGGHDPHYIHVVWVIASLFGVAAIVSLAILYRRAARQHEIEEAEQVIAEHDADLK